MIVRIRRADGSWLALKLLRGRKGDKGDKGDPGTGLELLDAYDTLEELRAAHPAGSAGDCYAVGTMVYVWSETAGDWKALGEITGKDGEPGQDGAPGADGKDGVGIASVVQSAVSTEDGGENVVTVTLTDGNTAEIKIKNGSKGSPGAPGATPTSFPASGITGTLPVANGGTGVTNLSDLATALGVGSNAGFVTGTYNGECKISVFDWKEINLGFTPSFVIAWRFKDIPFYYYLDTLGNGDDESYSTQNAAFAMNGYNAKLHARDEIEILKITESGFSVRNYSYYSEGVASTERYKSTLNLSGNVFCYIAGK